MSKSSLSYEIFFENEIKRSDLAYFFVLSFYNRHEMYSKAIAFADMVPSDSKDKSKGFIR